MISAGVKYKAGNGQAGVIEKVTFEKSPRGSKGESEPSFMGKSEDEGRARLELSHGACLALLMHLALGRDKVKEVKEMRWGMRTHGPL